MGYGAGYGGGPYHGGGVGGARNVQRAPIYTYFFKLYIIAVYTLVTLTHMYQKYQEMVLKNELPKK